MTTVAQPIQAFGGTPARHSVWHGGKALTYAIAFDLDTQTLRDAYPTPASWNNAYADIRRHLEKRGFDWTQGSVYFGGPGVDAVRCVIVAQELARLFPWFAASVRDMRMLRIEENNDLMPAVEAVGER